MAAVLRCAIFFFDLSAFTIGSDKLAKIALNRQNKRTGVHLGNSVRQFYYQFYTIPTLESMLSGVQNVLFISANGARGKEERLIHSLHESSTPRPESELLSDRS